MRKTSSELSSIARAGGGISVEAANYTASELSSIARALTTGAQLIVRGASVKTSAELESIARAARGQVLFEL